MLRQNTLKLVTMNISENTMLCGTIFSVGALIISTLGAPSPQGHHRYHRFLLAMLFHVCSLLTFIQLMIHH